MCLPPYLLHTPTISKTEIKQMKDNFICDELPIALFSSYSGAKIVKKQQQTSKSKAVS